MLVHLRLDNELEPEDQTEFEELVSAAGGVPSALITGSRKAPDSRFFAGSGKVDEIAVAIKETSADLVVFNHNLSPSQERNLEAQLCCRVVDRTGLILDIFAQRARTYEGKLQVELAQLDHLSSRLVRGWTHLERQKGGIGMRGPGETQLESDRRMVRARIDSLKKRLSKVRQQRHQGRQARARAEIPTVSLVGYTNAGKSTLFNQLAKADVFVADQLFATLDPTLRRVNMGEQGNVIFADTVGFISHLPHRLVEAFRATLEETSEATLLLHVVDAAAQDVDTNIDRVNTVLAEIGVDETPTLMIYNKIDRLEMATARIDRDALGRPIAAWVSAATGEGVEDLLKAILERLPTQVVSGSISLHPSLASLRAAFYNHGTVKTEHTDEQGCSVLNFSIGQLEYERIIKRFGPVADMLLPAGGVNAKLH